MKPAFWGYALLKSTLLLMLPFTPVLLSFPSCKALIPGKEIQVDAVPEKDYMTLKTGSPAVLIFGEDVEAGSVEALARIRRGDHSLEISYRWSGRSLALEPLETVIPGWEYRLELDGIYLNSKGHEREASLSRPFFWGSSEFHPLEVTGSIPENGEIIGPEDALYISFSSLPDFASLSRNLSLTPHSDLNRDWNGSTLILRPEVKWSKLCSYNLELDGKLQTPDGLSLALPWTLSFYVEEGCSPPRIVQSAACSRERSLDFPWVLPLSESPSYSQGIRIGFSMTMDREETEKAFSLSPSLAGELCWISTAGSTDLAFIPDEGFDMGCSYTLTLASSARSQSEIEMEEDFVKVFVPDIPLLTLTSLECVSPGGFTLYEYNNILPQDLPVKTPSPYDLLFRFRFSTPFSTDREKQCVQEGITLSECFSSGGSPRSGFYAWESDSILTILYTGFQADSSSEYYYVLKLAGGPGGIRNGDGGYLKEDIRQLLRVPVQ